MATTSSNKQPLLVDSVFHYGVNTNAAYVLNIDASGQNGALKVLVAAGTDGAIVEEIYSISRGGAAATINIYLSTASDYLRETESFLVGQFETSATEGEKTMFTDAPSILAPVPQADNGGTLPADTPFAPLQFKALYVPRGYTLWIAREAADATVLTDAPLVGCQGGWY